MSRACVRGGRVVGGHALALFPSSLVLVPLPVQEPRLCRPFRVPPLALTAVCSAAERAPGEDANPLSCVTLCVPHLLSLRPVASWVQCSLQMWVIF